MTEILIVAQVPPPTTGPAPASQDAPGLLSSPIVPVILLALVWIWFSSSRAQKGKDKQRNDMLSNMKKGSEVQTIGGEFGRVVEVRDDRVLLKVDETSNTKIWYSRTAIHRVVGEEKAEAK